MGEFTTPSQQAYNPEVHLSVGDIAIESYTNPSMICLRIKQSKTDPFRQGVDIYMGRTEVEVCPVQAMVNYLAKRNPNPGALFLTKTSSPLTHSTLVSNLQMTLRHTRVQEEELSKFNGHSLRIGAATTAAKQGLEDSLIQTLGCWKSAAYKLYIKIPRSQLAEVSRTLARPK